MCFEERECLLMKPNPVFVWYFIEKWVVVESVLTTLLFPSNSPYKNPLAHWNNWSCSLSAETAFTLNQQWWMRQDCAHMCFHIVSCFDPICAVWVFCVCFLFFSLEFTLLSSSMDIAVTAKTIIYFTSAIKMANYKLDWLIIKNLIWYLILMSLFENHWIIIWQHWWEETIVKWCNKEICPCHIPCF